MVEEFKVECDKNYLRFENWKVFVESINSNAIIKKPLIGLVIFNNSSGLNSLLLSSDDKSKFHFIIVDNHSCESEKINTQNLISDIDHTYIYLRENLGGAGGYAVLTEFFLNETSSDSIIFTEDDAIPNTNRLASSINSVDKSIDVVKVIYLELAVKSFTFHFTRYSRHLLEVIGCPDPRYFMRSDDKEFEDRIQSFTHGKSEVLVEHSYSHPIYKAQTVSWADYFSIRNTLFTYERCKRDQSLIFEVITKILYAFSRFVLFYDKKTLLVTFIAWAHFLTNTLSKRQNENALRELRIPSALGFNEKFVEFEKLEIDYFCHGASFRKFISDDKNYKIINFFKSKPLFSSEFSPLIFLALLFINRNAYFVVSASPEGLVVKSKRVRLINLLTFVLLSPILLILIFIFLILASVKISFMRLF